MAENKRDNKIIIILEEIFRILGLALLSFIILEIIKPKLILAYLNLNFLLLVWLVIGILILVLIKKNK
ncbi:hypothetical protein K9M50_02300 [Patescibacteria group bacterium]|nr:hypothetical protein [Patescibacteria group bacterium]